MRVESQNLKDLFLTEEAAVDSAVQRAVEHALRIHQSAGRSVSSWENDEVVIIPPEKIEHLIGTSRRIEHKNWTMMVIGVVIGIAFKTALTTDSVTQIISWVGETLRRIVNVP